MGVKVGDKVLVKAEVIEVGKTNTKQLVKVELVDGFTYWHKEDTLVPADKTYEQGLGDAWKLVKRAYKFTENARMKIFGCTMLSLLESMTPQEALAKLEAYEAEKTIKQWDVVEYGSNNTKILVTEIAGETFSGIKITPTNEFGKFGAVYSARNLTDCKKTNYKADLSTILAEIGKE